MSDFKIEYDEDFEILGCECCSMLVDTSIFEDKRLCEYCANSFISYRSQEFYTLKQVLSQMMHTLENRMNRRPEIKTE